MKTYEEILAVSGNNPDLASVVFANQNRSSLELEFDELFMALLNCPRESKDKKKLFEDTLEVAETYERVMQVIKTGDIGQELFEKALNKGLEKAKTLVQLEELGGHAYYYPNVKKEIAVEMRKLNTTCANWLETHYISGDPRDLQEAFNRIVTFDNALGTCHAAYGAKERSIESKSLNLMEQKAKTVQDHMTLALYMKNAKKTDKFRKAFEDGAKKAFSFEDKGIVAIYSYVNFDDKVMGAKTLDEMSKIGTYEKWLNYIDSNQHNGNQGIIPIAQEKLIEALSFDELSKCLHRSHFVSLTDEILDGLLKKAKTPEQRSSLFFLADKRPDIRNKIIELTEESIK